MGQSRENHADMIGIVLVKIEILEYFLNSAGMAASASYMHLEPGALIKIKLERNMLLKRPMKIEPNTIKSNRKT